MTSDYSYTSREYPFDIHITPDAVDLFNSYISKFPLAKQREEKCSGISDIINNIYKFFEYELREKEHSDIARMVKSNDHVINKSIMKKWAQESWFEAYIIDRQECSQLE
jgi:hypothetical protein